MFLQGPARCISDQQSRVTVSSRQYRSKPQPAAYLVDGYRRTGAFLVSERPRATTRDALWRLVWEHRVRTVVLMGPLQVSPLHWEHWIHGSTGSTGSTGPQRAPGLRVRREHRFVVLMESLAGFAVDWTAKTIRNMDL